MNLTFECPIHFKRRAAGRKSLRTGSAPDPTPLPEGTVPRISRLMALAIHFDRLLASGAVADLASLARRFRVTRARITQIMNLNRLAPEIQERLLFLPRTVVGRAGITERHLRAVAAEVDWGRQREFVAQTANRSADFPMLDAATSLVCNDNARMITDWEFRVDAMERSGSMDSRATAQRLIYSPPDTPFAASGGVIFCPHHAR